MNSQTQTAMQIIREACALVNATLADHQRIQAALQQIEKELFGQKEKTTAAKEKRSE